MKRNIYTILSIIFLSAQLSYAGGFQINEHGAKAMAMAGAFTGIANDPSAMFFNPAGLTQLTGTHIMAGVTLIAPSATFRGPSPDITEYSMESQLFTPYNFYISHQVNDDLAVGFGANNPYGLGSLWSEDWVGRFLAIDTEVRTFFFTPTIAYKLTDELSVGVSASIALADVVIERKTGFSIFPGEALISLKSEMAMGFGYNAGIMYQPSKHFSLGLSFRSEVQFDFEGTATAEGVPVQLASQVPTGAITAPLTTPMNITFGLGIKPDDKLTFAIDLQYVAWSSYDKLEVTFTESGIVSTSTRDYQNTYLFRVGGEYLLSDDFALRAGVFYDNNPVKNERVDPTLPDADRIGLNIGFGYKISKNLSIDFSYLFLRFFERTITNSKESYTSGFAPFNGVYNSTAHLTGFNFSYNF